MSEKEIRDFFRKAAKEYFGKNTEFRVFVEYKGPTSNSFWKREERLYDLIQRDLKNGEFWEKIETFFDIALRKNLDCYVRDGLITEDDLEDLYPSDEYKTLEDKIRALRKGLEEGAIGIMDLPDLYHYMEQDFLESLEYWIIYYRPITPVGVTKLAELAYEVGLVPFSYEREFYIALGGCGMDLSPLLDYFQFKVEGTIPDDSALIKSPEYSKSVIGEKAYEEFEKEWMSKRRYFICIEED